MKEFDKLVDIMEQLRGENGCPWDKEQSFETLKTFLIEESYEAIEAIDEKDYSHLCEELGDLQLQIVFLSQIAKENNLFNVEDALKSINEKMIRRHPHVFGDTSVENSDDVLTNWEKIKTEERQNNKEKKKKGFLSGISKQLPALQAAYQIGVKTSRVGFDWENAKEVEKKVLEEWNEYREAVNKNDQENIKEELGDLLFTIANLARKHHIEPEDALRLANKKFMKRFEYIEDKTNIHDSSTKDLEKLWNEVKKIEK